MPLVSSWHNTIVFIKRNLIPGVSKFILKNILVAVKFTSIINAVFNSELDLAFPYDLSSHTHFIILIGS